MKQFKTFRLKDAEFDDDAGQFRAVFATMNVIDSDDDVTLSGAFGDQKVIISGYGHASWGGGTTALPVGKGRIFEKGDDAIVDGRFFLDTEAGKETYLTVKNVDELQEWSYALPEIDYEFEQRDGRTIRALKRIVVNEVSPVLMGAGVATRLLGIKKSDKIKLSDHIEAAGDTIKVLVERLESLKALRESQGKETMSDAVISEVVELIEAIKGFDGRLHVVIEVPKPDDFGVEIEAAKFQKYLLNGRIL